MEKAPMARLCCAGMSALALKTARREILPHRANRVGRSRHANADRVKEKSVRTPRSASSERVGRFLSVDPLIQNPLSSQGLNPYSYIGNNPLAGKDPTGYAFTGYMTDCTGSLVSHGSCSGPGFKSIQVGSASVSERNAAVAANLSAQADVVATSGNGADKMTQKGATSTPSDGSAASIGTPHLDISKGIQVAYTCNDASNCSQFDAGLQKVRNASQSPGLTEEERQRLKAVADDYGNKGDPGINVNFSDKLPGGAVTNRNADGTEDITFGPTRQDGAVPPRYIAHEGQHALDDKRRGRDLGSYVERRQTEVNAYTTEATYNKAAFETTSRELWTPLHGFDYKAINRSAIESINLACGSAPADPSCK